jgi:hypothetical protein
MMFQAQALLITHKILPIKLLTKMAKPNIMLSVTMMCFTDFFADIETQYKVGFVSCGLVVGHLLINVSIMLKTSVKQIMMKFKR